MGFDHQQYTIGRLRYLLGHDWIGRRASWLESRAAVLCKTDLLTADLAQEVRLISLCREHIRGSNTDIEAFTWISDQITASARLTQGLVTSKIRELYKASQWDWRSRVSLEHDLQWDPIRFLQDYYGDPEPRFTGLLNVLVLNGEDHRQQMLTCK